MQVYLGLKLRFGNLLKLEHNPKIFTVKKNVIVEDHFTSSGVIRNEIMISTNYMEWPPMQNNGGAFVSDEWDRYGKKIIITRCSLIIEGSYAIG